MRALIKYSLQDFMRSHKYFPPVSTFIILIFIFYAYKPNPIMDSYAVTSLILYVISAWVCISVLSLDPPVQRQLMILHIGGMNRYYFSKFISVLFISLILTTYAFAYPIIFNMFNESVSITVGLVSIANHILLSILGISIASFFSKVITESAVNSYGGLALIIVISIATLGIHEILPTYLKKIVWIIPPVTSTQTLLINWSGESFADISLFPFIWIVVYSSILLYLFLILVKKIQN